MEHWKSQGLTICWVGVDKKLELIFSAGDQLREEAVEAVKDMRVQFLHVLFKCSVPSAMLITEFVSPWLGVVSIRIWVST